MLPAVLLAFQLHAAAPAAPQSVDGRGAPRVTVPRLPADDIAIDGTLDEPAWSTAVRLTGFSQYQPVDGRPAEERTEVLVAYSARAIYFGIVAHTRDASTIRATLADRDNIDNDDRVSLYLDTFDDRRRAFFFTVNPLGVQGDGVRTEGAVSAGNMFGGSVDKNPDYRFDSKGRLTDSGYVVEVRIPFKSLRLPSTAEQRWGINVHRFVKAANVEDTWTDAKRGQSSFIAQSGTLVGIRDIERGIVTEAQPFVTSSVRGERAIADGRFAHDPVDRDAGLNLRVGFPAISLDATVNPDFSQVESDAGLVTANERFALFIPEKRPFFLEGIELFATPNQLVYTRQIVDPAAGGKITGKIGRFSVAYLSALDDGRGRDLPAILPRDSTPPRYALFDVVRLRTDYGGSSVAGLTLTDRRQGAFSNTVLAADTRYVFRKLYYFEPQLGASWTRGDAAVGTRAAPLWKLELDRTGRAWGFNYSINSIDDDFRTDAGFLPRVGVVNAHAYNRFSWFGASGARLQSATVFLGPVRYWTVGDFGWGDAIEGTDEATGWLTFRGGWSVQGHVGRNFFSLPSAAYATFRVRDPSGALVPFRAPARLDDLLGASLTLTTPVYRVVNASATLSRSEVAVFAEGSEGRETRATTTVTLRPTTRLRAEASAVLSSIARATGGEYARTIIPRAKVEYQPTRALFFRVVSEYRSERVAGLIDARTGLPLLDLTGVAATADAGQGSVRTDWLISYQPTPGTVAFLGYGDTRASDDASSLRGLRREADGVFAKIAYQFRR